MHTSWLFLTDRGGVTCLFDPRTTQKKAIQEVVNHTQVFMNNWPNHCDSGFSWKDCDHTYILGYDDWDLALAHICSALAVPAPVQLPIKPQTLIQRISQPRQGLSIKICVKKWGETSTKERQAVSCIAVPGGVMVKSCQEIELTATSISLSVNFCIKSSICLLIIWK